MPTKQKRSLAMFLIPSIVGILIFMIPVRFQGTWTILVKILADFISSHLEMILPLLCVLILISLCLQVIAHGFAAAADLLIFLVIFSTLYALAAVFVFAAKGSIRREENDAEEYESMFQKTPKKTSDSNPNK